jgi:hypothetical protein
VPRHGDSFDFFLTHASSVGGFWVTLVVRSNDSETEGSAVAASPPSVTMVAPTRDRPGPLERAVAAVLGQDHPGEIDCDDDEWLPGRLAIAAGLGHTRRARRSALPSLRLRPNQLRAFVVMAISARLVTVDHATRIANACGRGL